MEPGNELEPSYRHVLLPLDGSDLSAAALPTAQAVATRFGAQLAVVAVADGERDIEGLRRRVEESTASETPPVDVVVATDVARAIVDHAADLDDCIVCMSTMGRGRVSGALIGSTARSVLQTCRQPIVAVGRQADRPPMLSGRPPRRPRSWPEPLSIPRIVACVDGSEASEEVLPISAGWATALGMQLTVLTVAEDAASFTGEPRNRFGPADAAAYVQGLAAQCRERGAEAAGLVVHDPISPAAGVTAHLAAEPAGLVALTTHARSGVGRIRLGATAADIVRTSPVPALVLPLSEG